MLLIINILDAKKHGFYKVKKLLQQPCCLLQKSKEFGFRI
jgi:hypothetical protein